MWTVAFVRSFEYYSLFIYSFEYYLIVELGYCVSSFLSGSLTLGYQLKLIYRNELISKLIASSVATRMHCPSVQNWMTILIKRLFHSRLLDVRLVIANSTLRASLAICHLISNARSWNDCLVLMIGSQSTLSKRVFSKFLIFPTYRDLACKSINLSFLPYLG